jgi:hypothetical protein
MKIRDYNYELFLGDLGDCFCDYWNGGYISDIIHEIADNNTSCYNSEQYMQNLEDLNEHLENSLLNYAFNYIEHDLDNMDVTEEQFDDLVYKKHYGDFERLEDIEDFVKEVLGVE